AGPRPPRLLELPGDAMIWVTRKADDPPAAGAARQNAQRDAADEYRRLLYVAMTRAADRLIVCGAQGDKRRPDGCWYDLVCEPLKPFLVEESDGEDKVLRYRTAASPAAERRGAALALQRPDRPVVPAWLRQRVAHETPRGGPLSPSVAFDEDIARFAQPGASASARRKAMERGRIVHRLMQSLPDIPQERRTDAIQHFLVRTAKDFSPAERAEIARQVPAILDNKVFAEIFTLGSRPEVSIIGHVPRDGAEPLEVAGQVDRLSVTGDTVLIADYKTDRGVPHALEEAPPHYVTQLALYRAVLGRLYAGKTIRAALVFTGGPLLLEVPATAMDTALEAVLCKVLT
ncbi:MAG: PD-(D/E)XK nuclease family protein, partial [Xanthobacteraceae bacterium]